MKRSDAVVVAVSLWCGWIVFCFFMAVDGTSKLWMAAMLGSAAALGVAIFLMSAVISQEEREARERAGHKEGR